MLQCSRPEQFFTSRFLEVLILRLAFSCALCSSSTEGVTDELSLKRIESAQFGKMESFGVTDMELRHWLKHAQIASRAVVVLMRSYCENFTSFLELRSSVIQKILTTMSDFCAKVSTLEYFIDPSETKSYPLNPKTLYMHAMHNQSSI